MKKNILVTGSPGSGKTMLIEKVASMIKPPVAGFLTREICENGRRVRFAIESFDGHDGILAHVHQRGPLRIGKYGVNIVILDAIAVQSISVDSPDILIIIDEIGRMKCLSPVFKRAVLDVLESRNPVLASIALRGDSFIDGIQVFTRYMSIMNKANPNVIKSDRLS